MSLISDNIASLKRQIPSSVKVVAVSKGWPVSGILEAYNTGHRIFGENRVQELLSKKDLLPGDIEWHLIGHLQTNKVKHVVPFISMIQSVDSIRLLRAVNNAALKINRRIDCLLQFHIAEEQSKYGFTMDEVRELAGSDELARMEAVRICGVMGMATFTDDMEQVRDEFKYLNSCYRELSEKFFTDQEHFSEVSMGMSGDYTVAIEEGSTIIRIGSIIYGRRQEI